jgi:enoyl-CoA hydratase
MGRHHLDRQTRRSGLAAVTSLPVVTDAPLLASSTDGVLHLELNRPAKRNALSEELRRLLTEALERAATDDAVRAVVISGAGGGFCAGFDLAEIAAAPDPLAVFAEANAYHRTVHTFPKPIIAAVNGPAVAGGLDLALMCDLRVAGTDATLGQPQVRQGIPATHDLLAGVVGDSHARDLCLTGRTVDATEALRIGLVSRLTEPDQTLATALALAADLASLPAAAATKQQFVADQPEIFPSG